MAVIDTTVVGITSSGWAAEMHGLSIWWASVDYLKYLPTYILEVQFATDTSWGALQSAYVL